MTIQLHDLHQAVLDYLNTVLVTTVQQVQPAPNSPGSINPNEIGTFSVKVDNTGNDTNGVPLINLRHHFKFAADVGAEFIVPNFGIARTGTSTSDSKLDAHCPSEGIRAVPRHRHAGLQPPCAHRQPSGGGPEPHRRRDHHLPHPRRTGPGIPVSIERAKQERTRERSRSVVPVGKATAPRSLQVAGRAATWTRSTSLAAISLTHMTIRVSVIGAGSWGTTVAASRGAQRADDLVVAPQGACRPDQRGARERRVPVGVPARHEAAGHELDRRGGAPGRCAGDGRPVPRLPRDPEAVADLLATVGSGRQPDQGTRAGHAAAHEPGRARGPARTSGGRAHRTEPRQGDPRGTGGRRGGRDGRRRSSRRRCSGSSPPTCSACTRTATSSGPSSAA